MTQGFTNETSLGKSFKWNNSPKPALDSNTNLVALQRNVLQLLVAVSIQQYHVYSIRGSQAVPCTAPPGLLG